MQSDRLLSHAQGADHQNSSSQQAVQDAREHVRALVLSNPANSCYLHSFVLSIMWTFTFVPGTVERPADLSGGAVTEDWLSFCGVRSRSLAKIVCATFWSGDLSFIIGGSLNVDMMFRSSPHMSCRLTGTRTESYRTGPTATAPYQTQRCLVRYVHMREAMDNRFVAFTLTPTGTRSHNDCREPSTAMRRHEFERSQQDMTVRKAIETPFEWEGIE